MSWFRVDDGFHDHPRIERVPNAAIGLWVKAGSWCARYNTDGVISAVKVRSLKGTGSQVKALVEAGLWEEVTSADGPKEYRFIDWGEYQMTSGEREQMRQAWRLKKRAQRAAAHAEPVDNLLKPVDNLPSVVDNSQKSVDKPVDNFVRCGELEASVFDLSANRTQIETKSNTTMPSNETQSASELKSNETQNAFKSNTLFSVDQGLCENVPPVVPEMSPEGTNWGVPKMSGIHTIPIIKKGVLKEKTCAGGREPATSSAEGEDTLTPPFSFSQETTFTGASPDGDKRLVTCEKHAGLPAEQIPACYACKQARLAHENRVEQEKQARRAAIAACSLCDRNGFRSVTTATGGVFVTRCEHQGPPPAVEDAGNARPKVTKDQIRSIRGHVSKRSEQSGAGEPGATNQATGPQIVA